MERLKSAVKEAGGVPDELISGWSVKTNDSGILEGYVNDVGLLYETLQDAVHAAMSTMNSTRLRSATEPGNKKATDEAYGHESLEQPETNNVNHEAEQLGGEEKQEMEAGEPQQGGIPPESDDMGTPAPESQQTQEEGDHCQPRKRRRRTTTPHRYRWSVSSSKGDAEPSSTRVVEQDFRTVTHATQRPFDSLSRNCAYHTRSHAASK